MLFVKHRICFGNAKTRFSNFSVWKNSVGNVDVFFERECVLKECENWKLPVPTIMGFCKWNERVKNIEWLPCFIFGAVAFWCAPFPPQYHIHLHGTLSFLVVFFCCVMFPKAEPRRGKAYRWKFQRISKTITKNKYDTRRRWCVCVCVFCSFSTVR